MDLEKLDEKIKRAEEEKKEAVRREKYLRDTKRKFKESEVLKILRKYNLAVIYSPEKREMYENGFKELETRLKSNGVSFITGGNLNE